nr:immunoglobulin light chain junction region [Macaca mulatta]MOW65716.1 immunoglobulin light chain junction region [Macaca mulatta]
CGQGSHLTF